MNKLAIRPQPVPPKETKATNEEQIDKNHSIIEDEEGEPEDENEKKMQVL